MTDTTPETPVPETRDCFPHFLTIPTRWMDNDIYGHVNNERGSLQNHWFSRD